MRKNRLKEFVYLFICLFVYLAGPGPAWAQAGADVFGNINPPGWLTKHGAVEVGPGFGLINFLSNVLKLATVVAGLFGLINLILAGFDYITSSGEPEKLKNASSKIWNSLTGLIIIAASYTIAALIGWLLFGDASAIISPRIYGPGV